jgi:hypothetical protein
VNHRFAPETDRSRWLVMDSLQEFERIQSLCKAAGWRPGECSLDEWLLRKVLRVRRQRGDRASQRRMFRELTGFWTPTRNDSGLE